MAIVMDFISTKTPLGAAVHLFPKQIFNAAVAMSFSMYDATLHHFTGTDSVGGCI
jgi:hypothetical protein